MDEMMRALTQGVGAELGKPMWRDYFATKDIISHRDSWKTANAQQQLLVLDMLALGVFQRNALLPIQGALNFLDGTKTFGVRSVKMGEYSLDFEYQKHASQVTKTFFAITKRYGIELTDLNVSNVDDFITFWLNEVN